MENLRQKMKNFKIPGKINKFYKLKKKARLLSNTSTRCPLKGDQSGRLLDGLGDQNRNHAMGSHMSYPLAATAFCYQLPGKITGSRDGDEQGKGQLLSSAPLVTNRNRNPLPLTRQSYPLLPRGVRARRWPFTPTAPHPHPETNLLPFSRTIALHLKTDRSLWVRSLLPRAQAVLGQDPAATHQLQRRQAQVRR